MRLPPQPNERIDRSAELTFSFEGKAVSAFAGDTIGSALYAGGRRIFSRSFKYHRPRGLLCCSGGCANCLMEVDGVPNVRVCVEPARAGAQVRAQNVRGSLERDLLSVVDNERGGDNPGSDFELVAPARAIGIYEGGLVPVDAGGILYRFRADHIVLATGTIEQPLLFPGNDLVGVVLPEAVRRLVEDWA